MRRKWLILSAAGLSLAAAAALVLALRPGEPTTTDPPAPTTDELSAGQALEYMTSDEFQALHDEKRDAYVSKLAETIEPGELRRALGGLRDRRTADGGPSEDERRAFRRAVRPLMRKMHEKRMETYFELPEDERTACLDEQIDEMLEHRKRWEERRKQREAEQGSGDNPSSSSSEPERPRRRGPGPSLQWIKQRIEHSTPEERATRQAYHEAIRKRMEERGIQFRGPGRPP
ncbi:MAG: hypothetical protein ACOC8E_00070 [Planctomycetota bacterium]